jgi:hypothetical protein
MNENDLRDCFAMFAMLSKFYRSEDYSINAKECYVIADAMVEARKAEPESDEPEVGIVAVKSRRRK